MADVLELLLLVGRLDRFLKQSAPRINIHTEYEYFHLVPQYIDYVHNLSQLLNNTEISAADNVVLQSIETLRRGLPRIETFANSRDWQQMLEASYNFAASPFTEEIIAGAQPLAQRNDIILSGRAIGIPPVEPLLAVEPLPGGGGKPVVKPEKPPPPPRRRDKQLLDL